MPTSTVEDYLKSILRLTQDADGIATVGGIAAELGVTPGTVSSMMRHLSDQNLIDYVPRKSVTLLPEGRQQALLVVRRHRLIESFLVEIMRFDWSEVHEEAEVLEHVVSDRLLQRMDDILGHPSHDPHGDPIPDASGNLEQEDTHSLAEANVGPTYRIVRVQDSDPNFLDWLRENGLLPGCEIKLASRDAMAGVTEVIGPPPEHRTTRLGDSAATGVLVVPVRNAT
ncbi:MAG: metal-dependent transcriptional regulator [Verrucomicrobiae bacterium]|nr:metal-dependent transcriptional regulator [Verrucomicrobiae bacterium]